MRGNCLLQGESVFVADAAELLKAIRHALEGIKNAEADLAARRAEYRRAIAAAHAGGLSLSAIGRELGVSRQRVKNIIDEDDSA